MQPTTSTTTAALAVPLSLSIVLLAPFLAAQGGAAEARLPEAGKSRSGATPMRVTFTEHVAPILFHNCTSCHRAGEVGPFPLTNYQEARKRGRMIARVTRMRYMPPWHPVAGQGEFADSLRMQRADIETLQEWVRTGMAEGEARHLPKMPDYPDGWQLGEPDLVVRMQQPFRVPASGPDIYRNFVVELNLPEDKWLTAIEVRPSARAVLHHIIFRLTDGAGPGRNDFGFGRGNRGQIGTSTAGLGGWAVGGQPRHLPMGLAVLVPKGNNLVLSSHFHPSGKEELERTTLGLHFTDKPPSRTMVGIQLPPFFGVGAGINVPPGKSDFTIRDSFTLPVDVLGLTIGGHAHYILKQMQVWATVPGGERKSIFWIDNWAFNWQNRYQYKEPLQLPRGTRIDVQLVYDNSAQNPNNPNDPPRRIGWGLQSTDEMGSVTLLTVCKEEADVRELKRAIRQHTNDHFRGGGALRGIPGLGSDHLELVVERLDKNKDGKLDRDEIPYRYWRRFRKFDADESNSLEGAEIEELKKGGSSILDGGGRRRGR